MPYPVSITPVITVCVYGTCESDRLSPVANRLFSPQHFATPPTARQLPLACDDDTGTYGVHPVEQRVSLPLYAAPESQDSVASTTASPQYTSRSDGGGGCESLPVTNRCAGTVCAGR